MRFEWIEQVGLLGYATGEPRVEDGVLVLPISTPNGLVEERYQLPSLPLEAPVSGAELALGELRFGLLISVWEEDGELVAQVIRWVPMIDMGEAQEERVE